VATIDTTAGRSGFERSEVERSLLRRRVLLVDDASMRVICSLILRTVDFDITERMRAYALGVAGFVTKPFDPAALAALLSGVIDRRTAA
jgi:DNA-binding NtrC family response regulator